MSEEEEIIAEILREFEIETDYKKEKYEVEESIYRYTDSRYYRKDKKMFVLW